MQVAALEHCEAAVLVIVTVTPFLTTLSVCPFTIWTLKEVAVGEESVAVNGVEVDPPHCPLRPTVP